MSFARLDRSLPLVLFGLAAWPSAQSIRLTEGMARGNLYLGSAELSRDGQWVVFSGRYSWSGRGINSLYCVPSDGSAEPFTLYDNEDQGPDPYYRREFDPGRVAFFHLTSDSQYAVFTVDERGFFGIYADRKTVPDADVLARALERSLDELLAVAEREALVPA